jgi:hypothetical protein
MNEEVNMENIRSILFIVINSFFGLLTTFAIGYLIRSRIMLSKRNKILAVDKIITQRRHLVFAAQGIVVLVVV